MQSPCYFHVDSTNQLPFTDVSDSSSDENSVLDHPSQVFDNHPSRITSTYPHNYAQQVFDKMSVVETLNFLIRKPKTAFFFIAHLKESGFEHDVVTYMTIIRFFCYWGMMNELKFLFLEVMEDKVGAFRFNVSDLFEEMLIEINVDGSKSLVRGFDGLIKAFVCLGRFGEAFDVLLKIEGDFLPCVSTCNFLMNQVVEDGKVDMAMLIYEHLKMNGFCPDVRTYGILVKGLSRNNRAKEARDVINEMKEAGFEPDSCIFGSYIKGLCLNGNTDSAFQLLKVSNSLVDVLAYSNVIHGFVKESNLEDAENVFLEMKLLGINPDAYCYGALIEGYCKKGDIHKAIELHCEMTSKGIKTNCVIISSIMQCLCHHGMFSDVVDQFVSAMEDGIFLDEICFNITIHALCKLGKMSEAVMLLNEMKVKKMKLDIKHYTTLINGYCRLGDLKNALKLYYEMNMNGLKPDAFIIHVLIGAFSKHGLVKQTMDLLSFMTSLGFETTSATHNIVIDGLCKGGKVHEAGLYFKKLARKSLNNYVTMMIGYCNTNNIEKAYELFIRLSEQQRNGLLVTHASLCKKLLSSLCEKGETDGALKLFKTILKSENGPSKAMYSKLMSAYCRAGDMRMARFVFDEMIANGITPGTVMYTILLNGYFRRERLEEAYNLFIDMINRGLQPDIITYTVLYDGVCKVKRKGSICNSSGGELSGLSRYMRTEMRDMVPDVVWYTVLIDNYCKSNNLSIAMCPISGMIKRGLQIDNVAYTALIDGYASRGFFEAQKLYDKMISDGIELDSRTMIALEKMEGK
ncbi:uncharacterized protein [Rutidosis leptorrhynchoides]|uniref:uncharacterized protein isoform X2 n=1 Tax=Rutidosis leptorrhynchoides TaxID=125765 RepID=UPI003A995792